MHRLYRICTAAYCRDLRSPIHASGPFDAKASDCRGRGRKAVSTSDQAARHRRCGAGLSSPVRSREALPPEKVPREVRVTFASSCGREEAF